MSAGLNRVLLFGNLGADPELRSTSAGSVLSLRLATTETYLDKDKVRRERTDWHTVVVWGKRGEALASALVKGARVFVEGSLRTSSYEKAGEKRFKTEVVAREVILGEGRPGAAHGYDEPAPAPRRAPPERRAPASPPPAPADDFGGFDDDIPF